MKRFWEVMGLACLASAAFAQQHQGSIELGTFMGASYGASEGAIMGGANLSFAATNKITPLQFSLLPYVEYSYLPNVGREPSGSVGGSGFTAKANYTANVSDFHGGVHLRFHLAENLHVFPYAAFGVGGLTVGDGTITTLTYTDPNGTHTLTGLMLRVPSTTTSAINYGGGLRIYMKNPRYGIRFEIKGYKPFGGGQLSAAAFGSSGNVNFNNSFVKAEAGFFFQFR